MPPKSDRPAPDSPAKTAARKPPRKMTRERLANIAAFHVERFATTTGHLREVLMRRIDRALRAHGANEGERATMAGWVEEVVEKLVRSGAVNDARFALAKAEALRRKGRANPRITATLLAKGVPRELIATALADSEGPNDGEAALAAAVAYARRRRLGPFRTKKAPSDPNEVRRLAQRELAALVRAGFALDIARRALADHHE